MSARGLPALRWLELRLPRFLNLFLGLFLARHVLLLRVALQRLFAQPRHLGRQLHLALQFVPLGLRLLVQRLLGRVWLLQPLVPVRWPVFPVERGARFLLLALLRELHLRRLRLKQISSDICFLPKHLPRLRLRLVLPFAFWLFLEPI